MKLPHLDVGGYYSTGRRNWNNGHKYNNTGHKYNNSSNLEQVMLEMMHARAVEREKKETKRNEKGTGRCNYCVER